MTSKIKMMFFVCICLSLFSFMIKLLWYNKIKLFVTWCMCKVGFEVLYSLVQMGFLCSCVCLALNLTSTQPLVNLWYECIWKLPTRWRMSVSVLPLSRGSRYQDSWSRTKFWNLGSVQLLYKHAFPYSGPPPLKMLI